MGMDYLQYWDVYLPPEPKGKWLSDKGHITDPDEATRRVAPGTLFGAPIVVEELYEEPPTE